MITFPGRTSERSDSESVDGRNDSSGTETSERAEREGDIAEEEAGCGQTDQESAQEHAGWPCRALRLHPPPCLWTSRSHYSIIPSVCLSSKGAEPHSYVEHSFMNAMNKNPTHLYLVLCSNSLARINHLFLLLKFCDKCEATREIGGITKEEDDWTNLYE